jgi:hypothetical protein
LYEHMCLFPGRLVGTKTRRPGGEVNPWKLRALAVESTHYMIIRRGGRWPDREIAAVAQAGYNKQ